MSKFAFFNISSKQADPDSVLMLSVKDGDLKSFETLVNKYKAPLLNFIFRFIRNSQISEEIAQETFFRVYRARMKYKPAAKFSTWLYRIAINLAFDFKKKEKGDAIAYSTSLQDKKADFDNKDKPVYYGIEKVQTDNSIQTALQNLPEKQRLALVLKVYEDKSYSEIAEIIGCSKNAVESLIFRARQNLKIENFR